MKTREIAEAYQVLGGANYQKMDDMDKVKVWKISREMKPIATKFQEDVEDARKKFIPDDGFAERVKVAQMYELDKNAGKENNSLTEEQFNAVVKEVTEYNKLVNAAVEEFANTEVELTSEKISEVAFGKLLASNNWSLFDVSKIEFIMELKD